jgi:hypothetical protein
MMIPRIYMSIKGVHITVPGTRRFGTATEIVRMSDCSFSFLATWSSRPACKRGFD